ncbi:MAG: SET domain-containing protein [Mariniblastus sp.]
MALFDITTKDDLHPQVVNVVDTHIGKGVYATRDYPSGAVIGEITGDMHANPYEGTDYTFEADDGHQLEPHEPFRYLNHSCLPNCEFDWVHSPATGDSPASSGLYLISVREIRAEEQFSIDYRWPASYAIPCQCKESVCRGWIVDQTQLDQLPLSS